MFVYITACRKDHSFRLILSGLISSSGIEHSVLSSKSEDWETFWFYMVFGAASEFPEWYIHLLRDLGYLRVIPEISLSDFHFSDTMVRGINFPNLSLIWMVSISLLSVAAVPLADHRLFSFFPIKVLRIRFHGPVPPTGLAYGNSSDTVFANLPLRFHTSFYSAFKLYFDYRIIKVIGLI